MHGVINKLPTYPVVLDFYLEVVFIGYYVDAVDVVVYLGVTVCFVVQDVYEEVLCPNTFIVPLLAPDGHNVWRGPSSRNARSSSSGVQYRILHIMGMSPMFGTFWPSK